MRTAVILIIVLISIFALGCKGGTDAEPNKTLEEPASSEESPVEAPVEPVKEPEPIPEPQEPEGFGEDDYTLEYTLADLNTFLPKMDYLIGANAPASDVVVVTNMKTLYISRDIETGDAKLTDEVDDYKDNFIIVGSPCDNPAAASLFAKEIEEKGSCNIFPSGEALILLKAVTNNDMVLYIGGGTAEDTVKAAEVVMYPSQYDLSGTRIRVAGSKEEPVISVVE